jgi:hypothetical protein
MTPQQVEQRLEALGAATAPNDSLVERVMERVNEMQEPRRHLLLPRLQASRVARVGASLLAVAACVALMVAGLHAMGNRRHTPPIVVRPSTLPFERATDAVSSLRVADFRRASAKQSDAFEAMLREQPVNSRANTEPVIRASDKARPDLNLN